jgi:hypothetical protein
VTHPEADLQIQVADMLRLYEKQRHFIWFSTPNELLGSARSKGGLGRMARFKRMGLRPGVADIVIVKGGKQYEGNIQFDGRAYFLELKDKGKKQSENQKQFEADALDAGAEYAVADTLDKAIDALRIWGIIP